MKIIGLTGGIASGKNFIADIFKQKGAMVFDADREVHHLLASDQDTIANIKDNFPEGFTDNKIDRTKLGKIVFPDACKLQILENILHPKVRKKYEAFLKLAHRRRIKIAVLNIPLLLERKHYQCDQIIAIITSKSVQKYRFLKRCKKANPINFSSQISELERKFKEIRGKQMSNEERKRNADFVILNGLSKHRSIRQVGEILKKI